MSKNFVYLILKPMIIGSYTCGFFCLTLSMLGSFSLFQKNLSEIPSARRTVWIQIRLKFVRPDHNVGWGGAQWLSGRVLECRGFEPHRRHCVVSLSKTH